MEITQNSQLGREGQAKEDHRYRPHALHEDRLPPLLQRIPKRPTRWRQGSSDHILVNDESVMETGQTVCGVKDS